MTTQRRYANGAYLSGKQLPIDDITSGNYVDALEVKEYYTVQNGDKSPRHRIVNNLLGPQTFCPIIRRTEKLSKLDSSDLRKRCNFKGRLRFFVIEVAQCPAKQFRRIRGDNLLASFT
jgi:hypothetical protein